MKAERKSCAAPTLYPPTTPAGTRRLLHSIHTSSVDRLKQDCFFYYLLREYDADPHKSNGHSGEMDIDPGGYESQPSTRAADFSRRRCLPRSRRVFMDGYWALDHGLWEVIPTALLSWL